jgi:hypothetical protein
MNYLLLLTRERQNMAAKSSEPYSRDLRILKTTSYEMTVAVMFMPMPKKSKTGPQVSLTESAFGRWHHQVTVFFV